MVRFDIPNEKIDKNFFIDKVFPKLYVEVEEDMRILKLRDVESFRSKPLFGARKSPRPGQKTGLLGFGSAKPQPEPLIGSLLKPESPVPEVIVKPPSEPTIGWLKKSPAA